MPASAEPDWDDFRHFLCAARAGTLAGAARSMGIEHTTVGRRLSSLERALGAALVVRGPEGLSLTPLGTELVPLAERMERAVLAVRERVTEHESRVRLALPSGFVPLFTPYLEKLRAERPGLALEFVSGARPVDLRRGEADLAIRSGRIGDSELVTRRLGVAGFSLYASKAYLARHPGPIDANDLRGHEVIGWVESLAHTPPAKWLAARTGECEIVLRSREMTDVLAAATAGVGLAVLPCLLGDREAGLVRVTDDVVTSHSLSLVYRREARLAASVRRVIRFVVEVIAENAAAIGGTSGPTYAR